MGIVDAAINSLIAATTDTGDVFLDLTSLAPKTASLMRSLVPIGPMAANSKSPNQEIVEFKKRRDEVWKNIPKMFNYPIISNLTNYVHTVLSNKVNTGIKQQKDMIEKLLNGELDDSGDKHSIKRLQGQCAFGENAPVRLLLTMHFWLVDECPTGLSQTDVEKAADQRSFAMQLFQRLKVNEETMPDPTVYASEISTIYHGDYFAIRRDLNVFKHIFPTYRSAVDALFDELQIGKGEGQYCIPSAYAFESFFNYSDLEQVALELKYQMIDLAYIYGISANATSKVYPANLNTLIGDITDFIEQITTHVSKIINGSLVLSWPSAQNQILSEAIIRNKTKGVDLKELEKVTSPLMMSTGLPNYSYQMFFVKTTKDNGNYEHYYDRLTDHCSLNRGVSGFETVIGRIPLNSTNLEKNSLPKNYAQDLKTSVQREMETLYSAANVTSIADALKNKIGEELRQHFRCWGFVRQWSPYFWNSCPIIDFSSSSDRIFTFSYANKGRLTQHCEQFQFYFFG